MDIKNYITEPCNLTWQFVLYPHGFIGHIGLMRTLAERLEYPYFAWNGRIYDTKFGNFTNLTVRDIN